MGRPIIKLNDGECDWYMEWSTFSDGPASWGMTLDEFKKYYRKRIVEEGMRELDKRLKRVEAIGTSSMVDGNADDTIMPNRAGKNETELTKDQIVEYYCRSRPKKGEAVAEPPMGKRRRRDG
jgi:hypothetical protein